MMAAVDEHGDGLKKLTEFMNQVRRQAENSIDFLNGRIKELEKQCEEANLLAEKYKDERDCYINYYEQLKSENNAKWKLQERDDWRALVDSLQLDRQRIQDELSAVEQKYAEAKMQLDLFQQQFNGNARVNASSPPPSPSTMRVLTEVPLSPMIHDDYQLDTQRKLHLALSKVEQLEKLIELERTAHAEEVSRLSEELNHFRYASLYTSSPSSSQGETVESSAVSPSSQKPSTALSSAKENLRHISNQRPGGSGSWSLFGWMGSAGPSHTSFHTGPSPPGSSSVILHV